MVEPDARTRSGGVSISGVEQVVSSNSGVWRIRYGGIPIVTHEQRLAWRMLSAELMGRTVPFLAYIFSHDQPAFLTGITHSDGSLFDGGAGYSQPTITASIAPAARWAMSVTITVTSGDIPEAGHHFSIGARLYRVKSVVETGSSVFIATIWPPLRDPVLVNTPAEFARPVCKVRLAADDAMHVEFDMALFGTGALEMIEVI